jgi:hypothetical protein
VKTPSVQGHSQAQSLFYLEVSHHIYYFIVYDKILKVTADFYLTAPSTAEMQLLEGMS